MSVKMNFDSWKRKVFISKKLFVLISIKQWWIAWCKPKSALENHAILLSIMSNKANMQKVKLYVEVEKDIFYKVSLIFQ